MICQNFWCKGFFENSINQNNFLCPNCRSNENYVGHVEVVKQDVSVGYNIKELMEVINKQKENKRNKNKDNIPKKPNNE
jgi:hypothetical protein